MNPSGSDLRRRPTAPAAPALIGIDWGTSSLRAFLLDEAGDVLETRTEPWGVMHRPLGDFAAAFDAVTAQWRQEVSGVKTVASGMIGSPLGWVEANYVSAPAGAAELAAALTAVPDAPVFIVPGVAVDGEHPDVMRGEETQIVGALALHPEFASRARLVLPGTHSKWVTVENGLITNFTTYLTGELFALLSEYSTVGRVARQAPDERGSSSATDDAFARGVRAAQRSANGVAALIFSARALVVTSRLPADVALDYLSGLLIGDEVRGMLADSLPPDALIGDPTLCRRYADALGLFDVYDVPIIDGAARAGLWQIACRAGLPQPAVGAGARNV